MFLKGFGGAGVEVWVRVAVGGSETGHWCVYAAPVTFSMAGVDLELGIRLSQGWGEEGVKSCFLKRAKMGKI